MNSWQTTLAVLGVCAAMISIVPLMAWGGSGDWRRALQALKQYLMVLGGIALVGGGVGLIMALSEWVG